MHIVLHKCSCACKQAVENTEQDSHQGSREMMQWRDIGSFDEAALQNCRCRTWRFDVILRCTAQPRVSHVGKIRNFGTAERGMELLPINTILSWPREKNCSPYPWTYKLYVLKEISIGVRTARHGEETRHQTACKITPRASDKLFTSPKAVMRCGAAGPLQPFIDIVRPIYLYYVYTADRIDIQSLSGLDMASCHTLIIIWHTSWLRYVSLISSIFRLLTSTSPPDRLSI